jgi:hypothetical protein
MAIPFKYVHMREHMEKQKSVLYGNITNSVTYVDTIIVVVIMVGASLTMALVFAGTVLSFKWWNLAGIRRYYKKFSNIKN